MGFLASVADQKEILSCIITIAKPDLVVRVIFQTSTLHLVLRPSITRQVSISKFAGSGLTPVCRQHVAVTLSVPPLVLVHCRGHAAYY